MQVGREGPRFPWQDQVPTCHAYPHLGTPRHALPPHLPPLRSRRPSRVGPPPICWWQGEHRHSIHWQRGSWTRRRLVRTPGWHRYRSRRCGFRPHQHRAAEEVAWCQLPVSPHHLLHPLWADHPSCCPEVRGRSDWARETLCPRSPPWKTTSRAFGSRLELSSARCRGDDCESELLAVLTERERASHTTIAARSLLPAAATHQLCVSRCVGRGGAPLLRRFGGEAATTDRGHICVGVGA